MAFPLLTSNSLQPPLSKDPSHWNSFLKQQAKLKNDHSILETYAWIESLAVPLAGIKPALPLVLKACVRLQHVDIGKKIHSDISRCDQLAATSGSRRRSSISTANAGFSTMRAWCLMKCLKEIWCLGTP
uniref:Uncharacterized protein n=1 Tax=Ananas comosus var. bracteatus TaxID=296719 RepID=A0A6V7QC62_ANACO|nr:unnamed protein product [Ananas comosus var. bracteatus]